MVRLTAALLRKRAEHHGGAPLATLEEAPLAHLGLEDFGAALAAHARRVREIHLQGNVVARLDRVAMGKLKDLEYLNLALNNLASVRGLARCERLARLDLSANFIRPARLRRSVRALTRAPNLREVWLVGNPCMRLCAALPSSHRPSAFGPWCPSTSTDAAAAAAVRAYTIARLPHLTTLDGVPVRPSERAAAAAALPGLDAALAAVEASEGVARSPPPPPSPPGSLSVADSASSGYDAAEAAALEAEVDALLAEQLREGGGCGGATGAGRTLPADGPPTAWTRAARLAEVRAREAREARNEAEARAKEEEGEEGGAVRPGRHTAFPPLPPDGQEDGVHPRPPIRQTNEGGWSYTLGPGEPGSPSAHCLVLELQLGKGVPPGDVRLDVAPRAVRVLVVARTGGRGGQSSSIPPSFLLQLALPARVVPVECTAARSRASGMLVVTMPRADLGEELDPACVRERAAPARTLVRVRGRAVGTETTACAHAVVATVLEGGEDGPPPLAG